MSSLHHGDALCMVELKMILNSSLLPFTLRFWRTEAAKAEQVL